MKVGFEKEFFTTKEGVVIPCPYKVPADECGWLAEARGEPNWDVTEAYFSLEADIYKLKQSASKISVTLEESSIMKVSRKTRIEAARMFSKGRIEYQNLYGHQRHRFSLSEAAAGLHVSFTDTRTVKTEKGEIKVNQLFDFVQIFRALDEAFEREIRIAKRRPGFYEIKGDCRIEYRSLPNNVHKDKLIEVLNKVLQKGRW